MAQENPAVQAELYRRYMSAMHGCQSAIRFLIERGDDMASPKHLRVGVSSTLVDTGAMVQLLVSKGIITQTEYLTAIAEKAEAELAALTTEARNKSGMPIAELRVKRISPGIYDLGDTLHIDLRELLAAHGIAATPHNVEMMVQAAREMLSEQYPNTKLTITEAPPAPTQPILIAPAMRRPQ